ncbi:hypothetical protein FKM82_020985 [Ascaphus truei]
MTLCHYWDPGCTQACVILIWQSTSEQRPSHEKGTSTIWRSRQGPCEGTPEQSWTRLYPRTTVPWPD